MRALVADSRFGVIRNLVPNPSMQVNEKGWGFASVLPGVRSIINDGPAGRRAYRLTLSGAYTPAPGNDALLVGHSSWTGEAIGGACRVSPFAVYNVSIWVRCSRSLSFRIQAQGVAGSGGAGDSKAPEVLLAANVWTRLSVVYTASATARAVRVDLDHGNGIVWAAGDTLDVSCAMVTEGPLLQPFADAQSPGWVALGAVGDSQSAGHPEVPRLENVAGPCLIRTTAGVTARATTDPFEDITMLVVAHWLDMSDAYGPTSQVGDVLSDRLSMRPGAGGSTQFQFRFDATGGTSNMTRSVNVRPGQAPVIARTQSGMTLAHCIAPHGSSPVAGLNPGNGFTGRSLAQGSDSATMQTYLTAAWPRSLTDEEVRRVFQWCSAHYGTAPPTF